MFNKPFNKFFWACSSLVASLLISACSSENPSPAAPSSTESNLETLPQSGDNNKPSNDDFILSGTISGVSQKGPFIKGSTVKLYELDEKLHQTGVHYSTTIDNDEGKYHIDSVVISKPYAWMVVNGYFLNEFTGEKSSQKITLNGLVKVDKDKDININVLSHLAFNRINNLVQQGLSIADAQKQAEAEVLKAFDLDADETTFENMNIFANGEGDAKLLAISLILLNPQNSVENWNNEEIIKQDNDIAQAIDLMAQITYDLESDGTWDNLGEGNSYDKKLKTLLKEKTLESATNGTFSAVRKNMKSMSPKAIPDFEKYVKKFISKDSLYAVWGPCQNEDELIRDSEENKFHICHNSEWENYIGFRNVGDPVVDTTGKYGTLTDSRDGKKYKTVTIHFAIGDSVTWMANPLAYEATDIENKICEQGKGCWYMVDDIAPQNYPQGICPEDWHIPQRSEWFDMLEAIETNYQYGELLFANGIGFYDYDEHSHSNLYFMWLDYDENILRAYFRDGTEDQYGAGITIDPARLRCVKDYSEPKQAIDTTKYALLTDARDGHVYKTLEVKFPDGTSATWMATLLEYEAPATSDTNVQNIPGLGRTYNYKQILNKSDDADTTELYPILFAAEDGETVQGICPDDWHIPNNDEWNKLIKDAAEEDKDLLAYPQKFFNKQTNNYEIPNGYNYSFNITGSLYREQTWTIVTAPNHPIYQSTVVTPPYGYTDVSTGVTNKGIVKDYRLYQHPEEFVLRCVKD